MGCIQIQTVDVREIKKIVETGRQIIGSKRTERGRLNCHVTELLGRPSLTLKPLDLYLASPGILGKGVKKTSGGNLSLLGFERFKFELFISR